MDKVGDFSIEFVVDGYHSNTFVVMISEVVGSIDVMVVVDFSMEVINFGTIVLYWRTLMAMILDNDSNLYFGAVVLD